jgi:signal transduction histidine kinase
MTAAIPEPAPQGIAFESVLQRSVACGVLALDSSGNVIASNPEAQRVLRIPPGQAETLSVSMLPPPVQAIIREAQTTRHIAPDRQVILHPEGNNAASVAVSAIPFNGDRGVGVIAVFKDASAPGNVESRLRSLDRLASVGTLSASMAHEIKNALVAVKAFADILLEKHSDAELAEIVRREIGRVDSITTHMLKFAAPAQPEYSTVEVHKVLDHCLRLVQHRTGQKRISFQREFRASADLCYGDDHQLEQAFVNILFNAVDAIPEAGTLTITTDLVPEEHGMELHEGVEAARQFRVCIADNGPGIAPEHMSRLFEPFFTTKPNGTGLGLAVTRRIIMEHGGGIHVETLPREGTRFLILLPSHGSPAH